MSLKFELKDGYSTFFFYEEFKKNRQKPEALLEK